MIRKHRCLVIVNQYVVDQVLGLLESKCICYSSLNYIDNVYSTWKALLVV